MRRSLLLLIAPLLAVLACQLTVPDYTGGGGTVGGGGGSGADGGTVDGGVQPTGGSIEGDLRFKLATDSPTYTSEVRQVASDVGTAAYGLANNGNTLAAMTKSSAGFTLLGIHPTQSPRTYVSQVQQASGGGVATALQSLSQSGYLTTGFTYDDTNGYVLVGIRDVAASPALGSTVQFVDGTTLSAAATQMGNGGYAITGMALNSSGVYALIGLRNTNSTVTYQSDVRVVTATQLPTAVQSLANTGFVVTALTHNGSGFVLVSQKVTNSTRVFGANVQQVSGTDLASTLNTLGSVGYVVTAAYSSDALNSYVVIGTK